MTGLPPRRLALVAGALALATIGFASAGEARTAPPGWSKSREWAMPAPRLTVTWLDVQGIRVLERLP